MTVTMVTRAGRAHAQRFLQHLAPQARDLGPELASIWAIMDGVELAEGRRQAAELLAGLLGAAELSADEARDLLGLAYLRLQYRLQVDGAGPEVLEHLASPEALDARMVQAMELVEPDLLSGLVRLARRTVRTPGVRAELDKALAYLADLSPWCPTFPEAEVLPAGLAPKDVPRAPELAQGIALPLLLALWPKKDNLPRPRTPNDVR